MTECLPNEEAARQDSQSGLYESHYQIQPNDTVLDLGAHVGYFTELAANKVGESGLVVAFEPHPQNFDRLIERTKHLPQVITVRAAAFNQIGMRPFFHCAKNSGAHSLFADGGSEPHGSVGVVDIGPWLAKLGIQPNFVKMDVEGAEVAILESLFRTRVRPQIAFETHSEESYIGCKQHLERNGYRIEPASVSVGVCYGISP